MQVEGVVKVNLSRHAFLILQFIGVAMLFIVFYLFQRGLGMMYLQPVMFTGGYIVHDPLSFMVTVYVILAEFAIALVLFPFFLKARTPEDIVVTAAIVIALALFIGLSFTTTHDTVKSLLENIAKMISIF